MGEEGRQDGEEGGAGTARSDEGLQDFVRCCSWGYIRGILGIPSTSWPLQGLIDARPRSP